MVVKFSEAVKKWRDNAIAAADTWATNVSSSTALENYIKSMVEAAEGKVSEAEFRASAMVAHYRDFQSKATAKKSDFTNGIERAYKENKWIDGLVKAMKRRVAG